MIHDGLWQMSLLKRADHNSKSALIKTHQLIKIFRAPFPCDTFLLSEHVYLYGKLLKFHFFIMKFTWFFFYPIIYIVKNYLVLMMHLWQSDMLRCYWLLVFMAPLSDYVWSLKPCPGDTRGDRSVIIIIVIMSSLLLSNSP